MAKFMEFMFYGLRCSSTILLAFTPSPDERFTDYYISDMTLMEFGDVDEVDNVDCNLYPCKCLLSDNMK